MFPWFSDIFRSFSSRYLANKLHHAVLLSGASGIGKYQLAQELGNTLLCKAPSLEGACNQCQSCYLRIAGNHPDLYVLESEKQLGVDKIREGIAKLSGTAQMSGNKVLLIPNADTMTEAAANALLKTLEEPTANTYLLLITNSVTKLMPTILSRCEKHALGLPSVELSLNYLKDNGVEDASEALLAAYGHAPLRVEAALKGEEEFSYRTFNDDFQALLAGDANSQAHRLAKKWQDNAVLAAQWCMQKARGDYMNSQNSSDYTRYVKCVEVTKTLQHPGVNKSMVLFGLLKQFQR
ncbi:MAG: DNA polymerase III subunit delta [Alteromonas sp.]|uniref:DNA polymerase III subunit delta' n=1 Tax=Alteromonas sp. MB-3u-76 TaxID=2058133 RepID=UPI000C319343|nr:DNA polymerase III subunit delta' [Alteromonas sp. MB-3u-76]AUC88744.1 DNA polymerase III subunit delta [Alteromonas sp. MB-3u-76]MAI65949.1 DNA polymerase III subunit delta [Alteromonas sp.]